MSWNPAPEPRRPETAAERDAIKTLIGPRARDIGGSEVRRALPAPRRGMFGPFIFFGRMGPAEFADDSGIDVRPHPHVGLATVTCLCEGGLFHRDSLGTALEIEPGAVNWMIAGRGIAHSERRRAGERLFGIRTWAAPPDAAEDAEPAFEHVGKDALPELDAEGKRVRLILGTACGESSPVRTFSEMLCADAALDAGARLPLPDDHEDRGICVVSGAVEIAGDRFRAARLSRGRAASGGTSSPRVAISWRRRSPTGRRAATASGFRPATTPSGSRCRKGER